MKTARTVRSKPVNDTTTGWYFKYGEQVISNGDMTEKVVYMPTSSVPYNKPNTTGVGTLSVCTSTGTYVEDDTHIATTGALSKALGAQVLYDGSVSGSSSGGFSSTASFNLTTLLTSNARTALKNAKLAVFQIGLPYRKSSEIYYIKTTITVNPEEAITSSTSNPTFTSVAFSNSDSTLIAIRGYIGNSGTSLPTSFSVYTPLGIKGTTSTEDTTAYYYYNPKVYLYKIIIVN